MFSCDMYKVEWYNKQGEVAKSEEKYLTYQGYNQEVMNMQTTFLKGVEVESIKIFPLN